MIKKILLSTLFLLSIPVSSHAFDATYYADYFEGGTTAYGNTFSQSNHSAAICYEELGQLTYVSTTQTGLVVSADDRPNCIKYPNMIDLSSSAFSAFAPLSVGRISDVSAVPLGIKTGNFVKRNISQKEFSALGIELSKQISNTYFAGETIRLSGRVRIGQEQMMTYIENKITGKKISKAHPVDARGRFDIIFDFPSEIGEYYFVIAAGTSFSTEIPLSILLVDEAIFSRQVPSMNPISHRRFVLVPKIIEDFSILSLPNNTWGKLQIEGEKTYSFGQVLALDTQIRRPQSITYTFTGFSLSTPSSLDRSPVANIVSTGTVYLDREYDTHGEEKVRTFKQSKNITLRFRIPDGEKVRGTYYVTLPNGDVREYDFARRYLDDNGYLKTNILIYSSFPAIETGTYQLEAVQDDGFAYFNIPVSRGTVWNMLPILSDAEIRNINLPASDVRNGTYNAINILRTTLGRKMLMHDTTLDTLAQAKAENMAQNNYVGHSTPDGRNIRDFAQSIGLTIVASLGENVAGGNVSGLSLQQGLEDSGSHRSNMIDPTWTKVGIGYTVLGKQTYMVHVFSE